MDGDEVIWHASTPVRGRSADAERGSAREVAFLGRFLVKKSNNADGDGLRRGREGLGYFLAGQVQGSRKITELWLIT